MLHYRVRYEEEEGVHPREFNGLVLSNQLVSLIMYFFIEDKLLLSTQIVYMNNECLAQTFWVLGIDEKECVQLNTLDDLIRLDDSYLTPSLH